MEPGRILNFSGVYVAPGRILGANFSGLYTAPGRMSAEYASPAEASAPSMLDDESRLEPGADSEHKAIGWDVTPRHSATRNRRRRGRKMC